MHASLVSAIVVGLLGASVAGWAQTVGPSVGQPPGAAGVTGGPRAPAGPGGAPAGGVTAGPESAGRVTPAAGKAVPARPKAMVVGAAAHKTAARASVTTAVVRKPVAKAHATRKPRHGVTTARAKQRVHVARGGERVGRRAAATRLPKSPATMPANGPVLPRV